MDHHSLDRSVNARIIRGNGGNGRGLGNGIGGIGSIASGSRNPPRQQERELSPDNSATHNNVKRKREAQDRLLKYAKDRYEKRDEYVAFHFCQNHYFSLNVSPYYFTESRHLHLPP